MISPGTDITKVAKEVILSIYLTPSSLVSFLHLQKLHYPFSFSIQFGHDLLFSLNKAPYLLFKDCGNISTSAESEKTKPQL